MDSILSRYKGVYYCLLLLLLISISSCAGVGMLVGGPVQQFMGKYSIAISNPQQDIFDKIEEVGKTMSLDVSSIDATNGVIELGSGTSLAAEGLIGKSDNRSINIRRLESGNKLEVSISVQGNFGNGTKEAADKLFDEFKSKFLAKNSQAPA